MVPGHGFFIVKLMMHSVLLSLAVALIVSVIGLIILASRTFYPHHRLVSFAFLTVGGGLATIQFLTLRQLILKEDRLWFNIASEYSLYAFMVLGAALFLYIFNKFIFREPSPLKGISNADLEQLMRQDTDNLLFLNESLERLLKTLKDWDHLAPSELTGREKSKLQVQWLQFVETSFELDLIKQRYRAFYRIDLLKNPGLHTRCFVLAYAALMAQHRFIFELTQKVKRNDNLSVYLNHPQPEKGLPANLYQHLKFRLTDPKTLIRLNAGRAYLSLLRPKEKQIEALMKLISQSLKYLDGVITTMPKMMLLNPVEIMEQRAFQAWYPIQKQAVKQISYVRAARRDYLITPSILKPYLEKFKPGDIMLQRREWHATNLGIPGYWTHLAFYTGSLREIDQNFKGLKKLNGQLPSNYLKTKYPDAHKHMSHTVGRFTPTVIEARRAGVIVNNVEVSAQCDSLAVLRPQVTLEEKFKALEYAFSVVGKDYDYSFDFRNDSALVCSELIYKGYLDAEALHLETDLVNGRPLFPPNKLAQKFAEEKEASALQFVFYLEGHERTKKVISSTATQFSTTWKRPKWFIVRRYVAKKLKR